MLRRLLAALGLIEAHTATGSPSITFIGGEAEEMPSRGSGRPPANDFDQAERITLNAPGLPPDLPAGIDLDDLPGWGD